MKIILNNIQSIKDAEFNLPNTGIVEFVGHNSNGKSILMKALKTLCTDDIKSAATRKSLINDNAEFGSIAISVDNKILIAVIYEDRNKCYFNYRRLGENEFKQTYGLRENLLPEHIRDLGFRVYGDNELVLQFCETFGAMPFINTTRKINGEIIETVCKDEVATTFIDTYSNITYKDIKNRLHDLNTNITNYEDVLASLKLVGNLDKMKEVKAKIDNVLPYLGLRKLTLEYDKPVPNLLFISKLETFSYDALPIKLIRKLRITKDNLSRPLITKLTILKDDEGLNNYLDAMNMICPLCKRKF